MEHSTWELFSPMGFQFRAYDVENNLDRIMSALRETLEQFKYCDEIQIEITAPPRGPINASGSGEQRSCRHSASTVVKGVAG